MRSIANSSATDILIVNASPIIFLGKTGLLSVLPRLTDLVQTTQCVLDEVFAKENDARVRYAVEKAAWLTLIQDRESPANDLRVAALRLGRGEASVLSAALGMSGAEAVLDDLAARRAASELSIPVVGTIGILIRAQEMNVIASAAEAIQQVIAAGMYVSPDLIVRISRKLGG